MNESTSTPTTEASAPAASSAEMRTMQPNETADAYLARLQAAYSGGTAAPAPASPRHEPSADVQAELTSLREQLTEWPYGSRRHVEIQTRYEEAMKAAYGTDEPHSSAEEIDNVPMPGAGEPLDPLDTFLPELAPESGLTWDEPRVDAVQRTAVDHGLRYEFREGVRLSATLAEGVAGGTERRWTQQDAWTELIRLHGEQGAANVDYDYAMAFDRLPASVQQDLARRGVAWHPKFIAYLAGVGRKIASGPLGLRYEKENRERPSQGWPRR